MPSIEAQRPSGDESGSLLRVPASNRSRSLRKTCWKVEISVNWASYISSHSVIDKSTQLVLNQNSSQTWKAHVKPEPFTNSKLEEATAACSQFQDLVWMACCSKSFKAAVLYQFFITSLGDETSPVPMNCIQVLRSCFSQQVKNQWRESKESKVQGLSFTSTGFQFAFSATGVSSRNTTASISNKLPSKPP